MQVRTSDHCCGYFGLILQKRLIDVFIVAALRKFFEMDLVENLKFLTRKYSIETLNDAIAGIIITTLLLLVIIDTHSF